MAITGKNRFGNIPLWGGGVLIACLAMTLIYVDADNTRNELKATTGSNFTITHRKDPLTTKWKTVFGNNGDQWLCNVTGIGNATVNGNATICVSSCGHNTLDLCNLKSGDSGFFDLSRWFGENMDEYSGDVWHLEVS